jgi:hypothetical protein
MGTDMTNEMVANILRIESPRDHNPNLVRDMRAILGCTDVVDVVLYLIYTARVYSEYNLHLLSNKNIEVIASMLADPTLFYAEIARQDQQVDDLEESTEIIMPR